jgi:hypothetical protein
VQAARTGMLLGARGVAVQAARTGQLLLGARGIAVQAGGMEPAVWDEPVVGWGQQSGTN